MPDVDAAVVRAALADAWEMHGRLRRAAGGATLRLPGARLMSSGLPHPQWNSGDVRDRRLVDLAAVRQWYADRGVPWGLRVPAGAPWPHGRRLFTMRLMGLETAGYQAPRPVDGLLLRRAQPSDLDAICAVDAAAFGGALELGRTWLEPLLDSPEVIVAVASLGGETVGTGYAVITDGDAGPAVHIAGIAVLPSRRRSGVGAAVSGWLVEAGLQREARLAHLHPDTEVAAALYRRLGFVEVAGLDVYVDV